MQERSALTALSPGAQLWLIPPLETSAWSKRIDWYLGFQIRRALPHRRFEFGPELRQLIDAYEDPIPRVSRTEEAPLMVASSMQLPNHQTVMIPGSTQVAEWVRSCHRVWKGLDQPSTRVFLPLGLSPSAFKKAWPDDIGESALEIVSALPF
jgi:hypothetical protein